MTSAVNKHKVPVRNWCKWSVEARRSFNWMFENAKRQELFAHTKANRMPAKHWQVIRWNMAWNAADPVNWRQKCA